MTTAQLARPAPITADLPLLAVARAIRSKRIAAAFQRAQKASL